MSYLDFVKRIIAAALCLIGALDVGVYSVAAAVNFIEHQRPAFKEIPREDFSQTDNVMRLSALIEVGASIDADRTIIDGQNSVIIYPEKTVPIILMGKRVENVTIQHFTFVGYGDTIRGRWGATVAALENIWSGLWDKPAEVKS